MSYNFYVWELPLPHGFDHAKDIVQTGLTSMPGPNPKFQYLANRLLKRFSFDTSISPWVLTPDGSTNCRVMQLHVHHDRAAEVRDALREDLSTNALKGLNVYDPLLGVAWSGAGEELKSKSDALLNRSTIAETAIDETFQQRKAILTRRIAHANSPRLPPSVAAAKPRLHALHAKNNLADLLFSKTKDWLRSLAYRRPETFLRRTWELLGHLESPKNRLPATELKSYFAELSGMSALVIEFPSPTANREAYFIGVLQQSNASAPIVYAIELRAEKLETKLVQYQGGMDWKDLGPIDASVMALMRVMFVTAMGKIGADLKITWATEPLKPSLF